MTIHRNVTWVLSRFVGFWRRGLGLQDVGRQHYPAGAIITNESSTNPTTTTKKKKLLVRISRRGANLWEIFRQTLGQSMREMGHAIDRVGLTLESMTWLPDKYVGLDPPVRYQEFLSRHQTKQALLHCGKPIVHPNVALVAPCATLIGSVRVEENASIWYGAILRADTCYNAASFAQSEEEILQQAKRLRIQATRKSTRKTNAAALEGNAETKLLQQSEHQQGTEPEQRENTTKMSSTDAVEASQQPNSSVPNSKNVDSNDDDDNVELVDPSLYYNEKLEHEFEAMEFDKGGSIYVGADTNLQDGAVVTARRGSTVIGQGVTVGHLAQIHSSVICDYALIGMGSILGEGCHVEPEALVAAGAVVPAHTTIQAGELWVGNPARKLRDLSTAEREKLHYQSSEYVQVALTQQPVMELGGNLGPDVNVYDVLREQLKYEKVYEESIQERVYRNNRWTQTIYADYIPKPPPRPTSIDVGLEEPTPQIGDGGEGEGGGNAAAVASGGAGRNMERETEPSWHRNDQGEEETLEKQYNKKEVKQ